MTESNKELIQYFHLKEAQQAKKRNEEYKKVTKTVTQKVEEDSDDELEDILNEKDEEEKNQSFWRTSKSLVKKFPSPIALVDHLTYTNISPYLNSALTEFLQFITKKKCVKSKKRRSYSLKKLEERYQFYCFIKQYKTKNLLHKGKPFSKFVQKTSSPANSYLENETKKRRRRNLQIHASEQHRERFQQNPPRRKHNRLLPPHKYTKLTPKSKKSKNPKTHIFQIPNPKPSQFQLKIQIPPKTTLKTHSCIVCTKTRFREDSIRKKDLLKRYDRFCEYKRIKKEFLTNVPLEELGARSEKINMVYVECPFELNFNKIDKKLEQLFRQSLLAKGQGALFKDHIRMADFDVKLQSPDVITYLKLTIMTLAQFLLLPVFVCPIALLLIGSEIFYSPFSLQALEDLLTVQEFIHFPWKFPAKMISTVNYNGFYYFLLFLAAMFIINYFIAILKHFW